MAQSGAPGRNRTDVAALIWRVLSPVYKAGALTNLSYRGGSDRSIRPVFDRSLGGGSGSCGPTLPRCRMTLQRSQRPHFMGRAKGPRLWGRPRRAPRRGDQARHRPLPAFAIDLPWNTRAWSRPSSTPKIPVYGVAGVGSTSRRSSWTSISHQLSSSICPWNTRAWNTPSR